MIILRIKLSRCFRTTELFTGLLFLTGRTYLSAELFEAVNDATDVKESRRNEKPSV